MNSNELPNDSPDPTALYPDLDMSEGLARALEHSASGLGLPLDGFVDAFGRAQLATDRGIVSLYIGAQERFFGVKIYEPDVVEWAAGATEDVDEALRAAAAWQSGMPLDAFVAAHPFMEPGKLARAFAEGTIAEAQWQNLLASDHPTGGRQLLARLAPHAELRDFFPQISYDELRFTTPPPRQDARVFRLRSDGTAFRVQECGPRSREYALDALDEVARRIVDFFASD